MNKESNQTIKCDVSNCKYNDDVEYLCTLKKIDITCTCNEDRCNKKTETICNSFSKRD